MPSPVCWFPPARLSETADRVERSLKPDLDFNTALESVPTSEGPCREHFVHAGLLSRGSFVCMHLFVETETVCVCVLLVLFCTVVWLLTLSVCVAHVTSKWKEQNSVCTPAETLFSLETDSKVLSLPKHGLHSTDRAT